MMSKATPVKRMQAKLMLIYAASLVGSSMRVLEGAVVGGTGIVGERGVAGARDVVGTRGAVGSSMGVLEGAVVGGTGTVGERGVVGTRGAVGSAVSWSIEQQVGPHVS
jgi:UDP-3-O-[3-hydroxymyristoyl] glucosamine N-acyltransferase